MRLAAAAGSAAVTQTTFETRRPALPQHSITLGAARALFVSRIQIRWETRSKAKRKQTDVMAECWPTLTRR